MKLRLGPLLLNAALIAGAALTVAPLLPSRVTFEHYVELFSHLNLSRAFANSLLVSVLGTACTLVTSSMAGYAFAKLQFPGREGLFRLLLTAMLVPSQVGMLPLFLMLKEMGLVNTYAGVLVPWLASVFGVFLVRQYALAIPDDLLNSARLDGASEGRIWWSIVLPTLAPVLATLAVFVFMSSWNDFLWPLVMIQRESIATLNLGLVWMQGQYVSRWPVLMAASIMILLPLVLVYAVAQRAFERGIAVTGFGGR